MTTEQDLTNAISRLRSMHAVVRGPKPLLKPDTVFRLDEVEQKLLAALRRDQGAGPEHDGFPGGHRGSGGQDAPQSTTEGAALAGYRPANGGAWTENQVTHGQGAWTEPADPHHQLTEVAVQALLDMDAAWRTLLKRLDAIDHARSVSKHSNPGGDCIVCGRYVEGTAADPIRRGMCDKDRKAWERAGRPELEWFQPSPGVERARWSTAA